MFIELFESKYMLTRFIMLHLVQNLFLYMTHNISFQLIHTGRSHSANMKHFDTCNYTKKNCHRVFVHVQSFLENRQIH